MSLGFSSPSLFRLSDRSNLPLRPGLGGFISPSAGLLRLDLFDDDLSRPRGAGWADDEDDEADDTGAVDLVPAEPPFVDPTDPLTP